MLVRVVFPGNCYNIFRLIPNDTKEINGVVFTTDEVNDADLVVVINFTPNDIKMRAKEAWIYHHEPSNDKYFSHWKKAYPYADRIFGVWENIGAKNFVHSNPYIFWLAGGSYDYYKNLKAPHKTMELSCITSSKTAFDGHKKRLEFLYELQKLLKDAYPYDIKGNGISHIDLKDEVLIPSKYSIVLENSRQTKYFTEKIMDAFLCYSMPIYYGAPDILDYFPAGSIILLDSLNPAAAKETITRAIKDNLYEKNFDKIVEARNLVLDKYNFCIDIVDKIEKFNLKERQLKEIFIPKGRAKKHPLISNIKSFFKPR